MPSQYVTFSGNVIEDPELRFTPNGVAVANLRIAVNDRVYDKASNQWKDGDPLYVTCKIWRQPAENVAESLHKGDRVIVCGKIQQRSYEAKDGTKKTVWDLLVDDIGASLKFATVSANRAGRKSQGTADSGDRWATDKGSYAEEPPF